MHDLASGVPEVLVAVAAALAAIIGSITSVAVERIRSSSRVDRLETTLTAKVEEVRRLSAPTGNGFARRVTGLLDELTADHKQTLATLGDLSSQVARLDKRIWDHIERHGGRP